MAYGDHTDLYHTGPGTLAGRFMRTFWQPIYRAKELPAGEAGPGEYWPCNFMTRIDNDPRHVVFTHRESWKRMGEGVRAAPSTLKAEETAYGVRTYGPPPPGRPPRFTYFHMPNINQVRSPR